MDYKIIVHQRVFSMIIDTYVSLTGKPFVVLTLNIKYAGENGQWMIKLEF